MLNSRMLLLFLLPVLGFAGAIMLILVSRFKEWVFVVLLGALLLGYLLLGKGIAYLGLAPLYISEITLVCGCATLVILAVIRGRVQVQGINHWIGFSVLMFMLWGAVITVPNLPVYRMDTLRDAVIWGYAVIAFCVALLVTPQMFEQVMGFYSRALPWILLTMLVCFALARYVPLPSLPGSPVPIIMVKSGDAGVHLGGIGAFLLLRLDRLYGKTYGKGQLWLMWAAWGILWVLYGTGSRSGMICAVLALVVALALRPTLSGWIRPAVLVLVLLGVLLVSDFTGVLQRQLGLSRQVSFMQISTNVTSLVGGRSIGDQTGTIEWRLSWWRTIWDYTINGDYFWTGKGFGVNLTLSDGITVTPQPGESINRHPHNITMNVLARAGIVGVILWLNFIFSFGSRLLLATSRPGLAGRMALWLLAYWMSFLFNAHTDVFLEGPMGGVWFWALIGFSWVFIYRVPKRNAQPALVPATAYPLAQSLPSQPA